MNAPEAGDYLAVRRSTATTASAHLYNLSTDISEQNNLDEKEPEKVKQLTAVWEKWNAELEEPRWLPGRGGARRNRRNR